MISYKDYTLDNLYIGKNVFWALLPVENRMKIQFISFKFVPPVLLNKYFIKSGTALHQSDHIPFNSSIEIKPITSIKTVCVGRVEKNIISGEIDYKFHGLIEEFKILIDIELIKNWILINDIKFEVAKNNKQ